MTGTGARTGPDEFLRRGCGRGLGLWLRLRVRLGLELHLCQRLGLQLRLHQLRHVVRRRSLLIWPRCRLLYLHGLVGCDRLIRRRWRSNGTTLRRGMWRGARHGVEPFGLRHGDISRVVGQRHRSRFLIGHARGRIRDRGRRFACGWTEICGRSHAGHVIGHSHDSTQPADHGPPQGSSDIVVEWSPRKSLQKNPDFFLILACARGSMGHNRCTSKTEQRSPQIERPRMVNEVGRIIKTYRYDDDVV